MGLVSIISFVYPEKGTLHGTSFSRGFSRETGEKLVPWSVPFSTQMLLFMRGTVIKATVQYKETISCSRSLTPIIRSNYVGLHVVNTDGWLASSYRTKLKTKYKTKSWAVESMKSAVVREGIFLFQCISFAIQRFNSVLLHNTLVASLPDP